jgi:uncharacterized protein YndB with AHSA1/START domain
MTMGETAVKELSTNIAPGRQELFISRVINAPRARVFRAHVDPEQIPKWWGPARYATIVDKMDARPGGEWRYLNRDADGNEFAFHGVYVEIVEPERITWTFEFEGAPGHISLETITFEETDGKTLLKVHSVYQSVEDRDAVLGAGMLDGLAETWDRLEALVTS